MCAPLVTKHVEPVGVLQRTIVLLASIMHIGVLILVHAMMVTIGMELLVLLATILAILVPVLVIQIAIAVNHMLILIQPTDVHALMDITKTAMETVNNVTMLVLPALVPDKINVQAVLPTLF